MERYCPPGTARFVPANKISPKFKRVHESFLSPKLFSAKVKRSFVFSLSLWNQKKQQREWKQRKQKCWKKFLYYHHYLFFQFLASSFCFTFYVVFTHWGVAKCVYLTMYLSRFSVVYYFSSKLQLSKVIYIVYIYLPCYTIRFIKLVLPGVVSRLFSLSL